MEDLSIDTASIDAKLGWCLYGGDAPSSVEYMNKLDPNFSRFFSDGEEFLCVRERMDLEGHVKKLIRSFETNWNTKRKLIKDKVQTLNSERQEYYMEILDILNRNRDDSLDLLYLKGEEKEKKQT